MTTDSIFPTQRRIRLGIWGLGRGMSFYKICKAVNIDVVAGCDFAPHLRERFTKDNPGAYVTDDADDFLKQDFDAVLLATYCPNHAEDAIRCLDAGKHVLSEVTAFHTPAQGVRLVEAVERSGKVYNLAENYPFSAANMWLAKQWTDGLFGDLMYAEFEYVHELCNLCYTYLDGSLIEPDGALHSWRSWLAYHYYCTHSLGPIMLISGTRPTRVVSLPGSQVLPGYPMRRGGIGAIAPSLISMSNGAVVRNLIGGTSADAHTQRIWGTRAAAFQEHGKLQLRLGSGGWSSWHEVKPRWPEHHDFAVATGHGGGDFWVLYYFARQILTGQAAPWDIYAAADVTLPGILAQRSAEENGRAYDVPDFRKRADRDAHREDVRETPRLDTKHFLFGAKADPAGIAGFNATMKSLITCSRAWRAWADAEAISADLVDPASLARVAKELLERYPELRATYARARKLIDANPGTQGARVLRELLEGIGDEKTALADGVEAKLKKRVDASKPAGSAKG